ncbi:MAG: hypothetical protein MJH09_06245 [Cetobacterium sp.]|nr:hypothetical protein [Cetobacterium sp.]
MKIIIIFLYMILGITNIYGQKEIPHETILDNPKAKITTIETKKQKEKATLNITVTKIKSKNINIEVNPNKKILLCNLNENNVKINKNEQVFFVENIQDIPTTSTINGERRLNHLRNQMLFRSAGVVADNELTYNSNPEENKDGHKVVKVEYKNEPKKLYMAVLVNAGALKSVYNANFKLAERIKTKETTLKIWLFKGEMKHSSINLIFDPSENNSGDFKTRSLEDVTPPDQADKAPNIHDSVFDFNNDGLLHQNFLDTDILEVTNNTGQIISTNVQGSFEKSNYKKIKLNINGLDINPVIWNSFKGLELDIRNLSSVHINSQKLEFNILNYSGGRQLRQKIHVIIYYNDGVLADHITESNTNYNSNDIENFDSIPDGTIINLPTSNRKEVIWGLKNFATEDLDMEDFQNNKIINDFLNKTFYDNSIDDITGIRTFIPRNSIVNGAITNLTFPLKKIYYTKEDNSIQPLRLTFFQFSYGNNKRTITPTFTFSIYNKVKSIHYTENLNIINVPILNKFIISEDNKGIYNNEVQYATGHIRIYDNPGYETVYFETNNKCKTTLRNGDNHLSPIEFTDNTGNIYELAQDTTDTQFISYRIRTLKYNWQNPSNGEIQFKITIRRSDGFTSIYSCKILTKAFNPLFLYNNTNSTIKINDNRSLKIFKTIEQKDITSQKDLEIDLGKVYFSKFESLDALNLNPEKIYMKLLEECNLISSSGKHLQMKLKFKYKNNHLNIKENSATLIGIINAKDVGNLLDNQDENIFYLVKDINKNILQIFVDNQQESIVKELEIHFLKINPEVINIKYNRPIIGKELISLSNNKYISINKIPKYYDMQGSSHYMTIDVDNQNVYSDENYTNKAIEISLDDENSIQIGYAQRGEIQLNLTKWNYKPINKTIYIKHYNYGHTGIKFYYELHLYVPPFDPLDYIKSMKFNTSIIPQRDKRTYELGTIVLKNTNNNITIRKDILKDEHGLRLIFGKVSLIDSNGDIYINAARIRLKSKKEVFFTQQQGEKLIFDIHLPKNLDTTKTYTILSKLDENTINDIVNTPENEITNYNIAIGRNHFFRELLPKITIKPQSYISGESTLIFKPAYTKGRFITFNGINLQDNFKLSLSNIDDSFFVDLPEDKNKGNGLIKMEDGDILKINSSEYTIKNGKLVPQHIFFKENNIKLLFKVENGNLALALEQWTLTSQKNLDLNIEIKRNNKLICLHKMELIVPNSFFRVLEENPMDFGSIIQGQKNINAKGNILFETTPGTNIQVSLSNLDKNNSLKIKHENSDILTVKDINSYTTSEGNNFYRTNVRGSLSVPEHQTIGNYKGKIMVNISIKQ